MKPLDQIVAIISAHKAALVADFAVREIGIFGSVVRGEALEDSDIDVLVSFTTPTGMIKFMALQFYLEQLLDSKVDLVPKEGLKPHIGNVILQEVQYVWPQSASSARERS